MGKIYLAKEAPRVEDDSPGSVRRVGAIPPNILNTKFGEQLEYGVKANPGQTGSCAKAIALGKTGKDSGAFLNG